jgi:type II secretory pathway component PulJ
MELLLAIAIAAVVMTIVNSVFFNSYNVAQSVGEQTEVYQVARIAMDRMIKDISCAYVPSEECTEERIQRYLFIGKNEEDEEIQKDSISFISAADMGLSPVAGGLCEIGYYLRESEDEEDTFTLIRREDSVPDSDVSQGGNAMEIAEGIKSIDIVYIDNSDQTHNNWDLLDNLCLPNQVKITLTFKQGKDDIPFTCYAFLPLSEIQIKIKKEEEA